MPSRNGLDDSFDEVFNSSRTDKDENNMTVASLIRNQPVLHHRRTPSVTKPTTNSNKTPLTTNVKSKPIQSSPTKIYETDFEENASADEKKKHGSLPPPTKQYSPETPRRRSESKIKRSFTIHNRRKERMLPYIRPKKRQQTLAKKRKGEIEQRLHSAEQEKMNELQSRLNELRRLLDEEKTENRALCVIQKREEKALKSYEDQEYEVHRTARDYTVEIQHIQEKINVEKESKVILEKELEERNVTLRDQNKRMKFYEKVVNDPELEDTEELRQRLKETDKKLKKYEEQIAKKEKEIEDLQENNRQEIQHELKKQRRLKQEIANEGKKYTDLLVRFEEKSRQIGTMHIYIQHGGRRPSITSLMSLSKSRSLQSLETSPRIREKILEYDQRRREEEKLKPKPKLRPLPSNPPPKPERKKYVPSIDLKPKPKPKKIPAIPPRSPSPPLVIEREPTPPRPQLPVLRRISTPESIDEPVVQSVRQKSPTPTPTPTLPLPPPPMPVIQRNEEHVTKAPIQKRPLTPVTPPPERKPSPSGIPTAASIHRRSSDEEKPAPTSMITFEPSSVVSNGVRKRSVPRQTSNTVYDFEQAIINLHEGKPVTAQPTNTTTTKTSIDPFDALFNNNTTKSSHRLANRDDTFTTTAAATSTTQDRVDPFESLFTPSTAAANSSTTVKPTIRQIPAPNDKLQRPKIVSNGPKSVPNRTVVEEIEEFVL